MYILYVVWNTGEKEQYTYTSREEAQQAADGYKMAFGEQVWVGIN